MLEKNLIDYEAPYTTELDTVIVPSAFSGDAEALNMDSRPTLEDRIKAIEQLTQIFRTDRLLFLAATALALLFLLAVAGRLLVRGQGSMAEWASLFGSSGLITVTINRILQMWTQALRLLASEPIDGAGKGGAHE